MEDPVPMITKRHFEIGLSHCRKSVNEVDLNRYDEFKRKFDPSFVTAERESTKIIWPDDDGKGKDEKKDDEDLGLYD
jgi:transitional endoplasmic reticulum ATPase